MNLERLREIVYGRCGLTQDLPVLVGVSGGPDSMCLMDGLARLQIPLIVAHFDHQLRDESKLDASVVEEAARRRGLPFVLGSHNVSDYATSHHLSIEEAARFLRYNFLFDQARALNVQAVAVGHTADDQVETLIMHLLRGTGLNGLKGMLYRSLLSSWDANIPLIRPLLSFWRVEILKYCTENSLEPVTDASNQDTAFFRNRVRQVLIPLLETYNPKFKQALWRTSILLADDAEIIRLAVDKAWGECLIFLNEYEVWLSTDKMQILSSGLRRGLLRKALKILLPVLRDVDFAAFERADQFIQNPTGAQIELVQGLCIFLEQDHFVITRDNNTMPENIWPQMDTSEEQDFPGSGMVKLASGWILTIQYIEHNALLAQILDQPPSAWEAWLDADSVLEPLCLRRPRPGDRIKPLGMQGSSIKLSDFWINRKLPRRFRVGWPLLVSGKQLAWIPGFQIAEPFRLQPKTRKALYLSISRVSDLN